MHGDFVEARKNSYRALAKDKTHPIFNYTVAFIEQELNNIENAIKYYLKAIEFRPDFKEALHNLAGIFFARGDFAGAKEYELKILEFFPNDLLALESLGLIALRMQKNEEAIFYWARHFALKNDDLTIIIPLGNLYIHKNDLTSALHCYERVSDLDPSNIEALQIIGEIYLKQGNVSRAIEIWEKSIALNERQPLVLNSLACQYWALKKEEQAVQTWQTALKYDEKNVAVLENLGSIYTFEKNQDQFSSKGKELLEKAYSYGGRSKNLLERLEALHLFERNFQKSLSFFDELKKLSLADGYAYYFAGVAHLELNNIDEAKQNFEKAIELAPTHATSYAFLGKVYLLKRNTQEAIDKCIQALAIEENNYIAFGTLAEIYSSVGDWEKARSNWIKCLEIFDTPSLYNNIAITYTKEGKNDDAERFWKDGINKHSKDAQLLFQFSTFKAQQKKFPEAITFCMQALEINPTTAEYSLFLGSIQFENAQYTEAQENVILGLTTMCSLEKVTLAQINLAMEDLNKVLHRPELDLEQFCPFFKKICELVKAEKVFAEIGETKPDWFGIMMKCYGCYIALAIGRKDTNSQIFPIKNIEGIFKKMFIRFEEFEKSHSGNVLKCKVFWKCLLSIIELFSKLSQIESPEDFKQKLVEITNDIKQISSPNDEIFKDLMDFCELLKKQFDDPPNETEFSQQIYIRLRNIIQKVESIDFPFPIIGKIIDSLLTTHGQSLVTFFDLKKKLNKYPKEILISQGIEIGVPKKFHTIENIPKDIVRVCVVQISSELTDTFPYVVKDAENIKKKVLEALNIAMKEKVNIICFPELSILKEWIEDLKKFKEIVIIAGSYYDEESSNVSPIIFSDQILTQKKIHPAPGFEDEIVKGRCMKKGTEISVIESPGSQLRFSVLICIDLFIFKVFQ